MVLGDIQRVLSYVKAHEQQFIADATEYGDVKANRTLREKRGELDSLPALVRFGEALEAASLQTLNDGIMTKDLCGLAEGITPTQVNSEEFIRAIRTRLEAKLA